MELLICQPQISQGQAWDQNLFSMVTGRSVTALAKGKTFLYVTSCGLVGGCKSFNGTYSFHILLVPYFSIDNTCVIYTKKV